MPHKDINVSHMSIFPVKDSLSEALADIENAVGEGMARRIFPLIMSYHNTLLKEISEYVMNDAEAPAKDNVVSLAHFNKRKAP